VQITTKFETAEDLLTRKESSIYLKSRWKQRVSPQTLATYAHEKKGPPYRVTESGADVFYSKSDLDEWARGRLLPGRVAPIMPPVSGALALARG
jgi:hypothetical protein